MKMQNSHLEKTKKKIASLIDESIVEQKNKEKKRTYLGASSLGDACSRKIQYRYMGKEQDPGSGFSAKV